jgi:hypothetical protein
VPTSLGRTIGFLIFIPREGEQLPSIQDQGNKIILKAKQMTAKAYEITKPNAQGLTEYEPILNSMLKVKDVGDLVLQSVDWIKKRSCALGEVD